MANFSYVKGRHKVSFKNLFNRGYDDNYYSRSGPSIDRGGGMVNLWSSVLSLRTFYTGIFEGSHQLTNNGIRFNWNAGYSYNNKSQPDLRTAAYYQGEWDDDDSRRFFSDLRDHTFSGSASLAVPFNIGGEKQSLKLGGSGLLRFRDFKSRIFRYAEASGDFNQNYAFLPFDKIFATSNIAPDGFIIDEFTNPQDKYFGISSLNAGYAMVDNKLSDRFRVIWGVRVEFFEQYLDSKDISAKRITIDNEDWAILPSVNFSFNINPKNILRVSGSKTVSRPEFRELAPFQFFDYEANYGVRGDPALKSTEIYNADLRYEMYLGTGEAITLGGFYKRFTNPIEFRLSSESVPSRRNYTYGNAKDADSYGVELELRKNLNFLGTSDILSDFSLFTNLTYIFSQVRFSDEAAGKVVSADRPVQGQSPYLINGGIQYASSVSGWSANILYNRVGNRLALVGNSELPDIYENPRDVVDMQISKKVIAKKGEIKLTFGDILNKKMLFYENVDDKRKYTGGIDRVFSSFKPGSTISLGFTYDFSL
ncbi:MAG: TonB-dependent receptor, partial [Chitinophagaceae bacterium]|nr:TonB-dependent receptor [Chitinophagaceae bacterium]